MFVTKFENIKDFISTVNQLNQKNLRGNSDNVTLDFLQDLITQNSELIQNSKKDVNLSNSLKELSNRIKKEPNLGPQAKKLGCKIDRLLKENVHIHFIWVGGCIPAKYLSHIKECAAKALSDNDRGIYFTVTLWIDNPNNYWKTAIKEDNIIHSKRFKLRHLSELNDTITNHYSKEIAKKIRSYVSRELCGSKNFAAASDIFRYIALEQEGGFYFDTDLTFSVFRDGMCNFDSILLAKFSKYRKEFWEKEKLWEKRDKTTLFNLHFPLNGITAVRTDVFSNCCIFAAKDTPLIKEVILEVIRNYDELDNNEKINNYKYPLFNKDKQVKYYNKENKTLNKKLSKKSTKNFKFQITLFDIKRSQNLCFKVMWDTINKLFG